jgi:tRNA U55 pseudouridine synthase TruB
MDMNDIRLIDKPAGWTSFDVVAKVRGKIRADYLKQGIKPTKKNSSESVMQVL